MRKHNLFAKKLKKQFLSINDSIERYFDKIKTLKTDLKKTKLRTNSKAFLAFWAIVIFTLVYLLVPSFYNKEKIQSQIKNHVFQRYNIDIKFNDQIEYILFPKPHFKAKNLLVLHNEKTIANKSNLKIFISINKLFKINQIDIKDLVFHRTDFNIRSKDFGFFLELLKTEPNENKIVIKKSNIFFKNNNNEVLFINKIYDSKFYYDPKNLKNILSSKNEIYNIPYKLNIKNDKFNNQIFMKFNSKKIRLDIENVTSYDDLIKKGLLEILFINNSTSLNYKIKKNSLDFNSEEKKNIFKGKIDFKPFYLSAQFNYDGLSFKDFLKDDAILFDLIKSEILNNKNLNLNLVFNVKDIINIDELNTLFLNIAIEEGNINPSNSSIIWKNDLKINLKESLLIYNKDQMNLIGKIIINIEDVNNFYRSFQVKKNYRKKINEIQFDFNYDLNQKKIFFDNVEIDGNTNKKIEEFIDNFNNDKKPIFNKITFKNFVSNFFSAYDG